MEEQFKKFEAFIDDESIQDMSLVDYRSLLEEIIDDCKSRLAASQDDEEDVPGDEA